MFAKNKKAILSLFLVAVMALVLGACSDDDKKKSSSDDNGGGGPGPGPTFPSIPSSLPDISGLSLVIDASGGVSDNSGGGYGGDVAIAVTNGNLVEDTGQNRPNISNNYLAPLLGSGGDISWDDLEAHAVGNGSMVLLDLGEGSLQAVLTIDNQGFFLPAGETLDFLDAPSGLEYLEIRLRGTNGRFRIDGEMLLDRFSQGPVDLSVKVEDATGAAIVVDGLLSGDSDSVYTGAGINLKALQGGMLIGGTITARGGDTDTGSAGGGGEISIVSHGNVLLRRGIIAVNGGDGDWGGGGGYFTFNGNTQDVMHGWVWSVFANGGDGDEGSNGGSMTMTWGGEMNFNAVLRANGGNGVGDEGGNGGNGGYINLWGPIARGALIMEATGGHSEDDDGGRGGNVYLEATNLWGLWVRIIYHGGDGDYGHVGGWASVACMGGVFVNALVEAEGRAGQGETSVEFSPWWDNGLGLGALTQNVTFVGDLSGGSTVTQGEGGPGAEFVLWRHWIVGGTIQGSVNIDVTAHGGDGSWGGSGGNVYLDLEGFVDLEINLTVAANGGNSIHEDYPGAGGPGGYIEVGAQGGDILLNLDVEMNGGNGGSDNGAGYEGGSGGEFFVGSGGFGPLSEDFGTLGNGGGGASAFVNYEFTGEIVARGGDGLDSDGGWGGAFVVIGPDEGVIPYGLLGGPSFSGSIGHVVIRNLTADLRGGDGLNSAAPEPGLASGGSVGTFLVLPGGPILMENSQVDVSGGNGMYLGGGGPDWGDDDIVALGIGFSESGILLLNFGGPVTVSGSELRANGGDGAEGGGRAGRVEISSTIPFFPGFPGAPVSIDAVIHADGGMALEEGWGGDGGFILIESGFDYGSVSTSAGTILSANGGDSDGTGEDSGGRGGEITLLAGSGTLTVLGQVLANGGHCEFEGGDGGDIIFSGGEGIQIIVGALVEANGGNADGFGGNGGDIWLSGYAFVGDGGKGGGMTDGLEAGFTLTADGVVRANGGSGGDGNGGGGGEIIVAAGAEIHIHGQMRANGGDGDNSGGSGGTIWITGDEDADMVVSGLVQANGGNADPVDGEGGSGGTIYLGGALYDEGFTSELEGSLTLTGTAIVEANGGAGDPGEPSSAGEIFIDVQGTGDADTNPNITFEPGHVIQTLDGNGDDQANIVFDWTD